MKIVRGKKRGKGEDMTRDMHILFVGFLVGALLLTSAAEGGSLGKAAARGAARGLVKSLGSSAQTLRRDLLRDRATAPRPLPKGRTVFRYTSKARAAEEAKKGIPPNAHLTSSGGPGRPLRPETAQKRYGLQKPPEVRETVRVPARQPVRPNRTLGGTPGVGEMTSPEAIKPGAIERVVPLRP